MLLTDAVGLSRRMTAASSSALKSFFGNRMKVLTAVCVIFHVVGLVGMIAGVPGIVRSTPLHLLLMLALLTISFLDQARRWLPWALIAGAAGFAAEWVGVHTSILFGHYAYGTALGPGWDAIPFLIAANWVVVVSGAVSLGQGLAKHPLAVAVIAALFATACDWLLEPVAVRLYWWTWRDDVIPFFNYACWAGLSFLLALLWVGMRLRAGTFAVILFLVQAMFFALLRLMF